MEDQDQPSPRGILFARPGMQIWLVIALFISCRAIFILFASSNKLAWMVSGPDDGYPVYLARIGEAIFTVFVFAIPAIVFANIFPAERFSWFRLQNKVSPLVLILGVCAILAANFGFDLIYSWCGNFISDPALKEFEAINKKANDWILAMPNSSDLLLCLFANAFIPALCEELFFRGTLQQLFSELTKKPHVSILITAGIFSLVHSDPQGLLVYFLAGCMLGYAFYWTGSLRIIILMHFLFNSISIIEAYCTQHSASFAAWEPSQIFLMVCLALAAVFMFLIWRKSKVTLGN